MRRRFSGVITTALMMMGCTSVVAASNGRTDEVRSNLSNSFFPLEIDFVTRDQGYMSGTIPFHGLTAAVRCIQRRARVTPAYA